MRSLGALPAFGYWLLAASLAGAAALGIGLASAVMRQAPVRTALAAWAALHLALLHTPWSALVGLPATFLALSVLPDVERRPRDAGASVALGLALGLAAWPRLARELGPGSPEALAQGGPVAVLLAVPVLAGVYARVGRRLDVERLPGPGTLTLVALLGLALLPRLEAKASSVVPPPAPPDADRPSVLLLILDTVRADHLSIYGYERETTPRLEALLQAHPRARRYELAFSPGTWTLPAHASLFTGTLPSEHGIHARSMFSDAGILDKTLLPRFRTLADVLGEQGYTTACLFANSWLRHVKGMERGFGVYLRPAGHIPLPLLGEALRERALPSFFVKEAAGLLPASGLNRYVLEFLERRCQSAPCFVTVNYMDAHAPYLPARAHAGHFGPVKATDGTGPPQQLHHDSERIRRLEMRYDEEILGLDAALGQLFDALQHRGRLEDTWIFVTSDHGEAFGEHGVTEHGTTVYSEVTRIPLVVIPPAGAALPSQESAVDLLDVAATIAGIGGVEDFGRGRDLRDETLAGALHIEFPGDPRKAKAHGALAAKPAQAVTRGHHQLVVYDDDVELYDLRADPRQERNIRGRDGRRAAQLERDVRDADWMSAPAPEARELELSEEERQRLRDLGYID